MTIVDYPRHKIPNIPYQPGMQSPDPIQLDASGEYGGAVFLARETKNLRKVHAFATAVGGAGDFECRIEGIDASGDPSGSLLAANNNATLTISTTGVKTWTLTADAPLVRGTTYFAVLIKWVSGNVSFYCPRTGVAEVFGRFPYGHRNIGAGNIKQALGTNVIGLLLEYDDGTFGIYPEVAFPSAAASANFNSGNTPDERGVKFNLNAKIRSDGFEALLNTAAGDNFDVRLYGTDGSTVLASATIDKDYLQSGTGRIQVPWTTPVELPAGNGYRLVFRPGATNINYHEWTMPSVAAMRALPGRGIWHQTERTNDGVWTDNTDKFMALALWIDGIDDPAGGLLTHPGMAGGLRA